MIYLGDHGLLKVPILNLLYHTSLQEKLLEDLRSNHILEIAEMILIQVNFESQQLSYHYQFIADNISTLYHLDLF